MRTPEVIAGIDVGSNATRLLIQEVREVEGEKPVFTRLNFLRMPLRLGADTFVSGRISKESSEKMLENFKLFKHLMQIYRVNRYRIFATSAMRDAINKSWVVTHIGRETGLNIEVIDGDREAHIISKYLIQDFLSDDHVLFVDVGGGSTELQFYEAGNLTALHSFDIGTVRMLSGRVSEYVWDDIRSFLVRNLTQGVSLRLIGTGGNINKVLKLSPYQREKVLPLEYLFDLYKKLESRTHEQRICDLGLRDDRADVICPALQIFLFIAKNTQARSISVPKIGLVDGIIKSIYYEGLSQ